ncbi:MAG: hypothetical protein EBT78_16245, partial [Betaproteobacteria bacterium]|nr:hypothetical protein [Betaproteobacteria bacterium]
KPRQHMAWIIIKHLNFGINLCTGSDKISLKLDQYLTQLSREKVRGLAWDSRLFLENFDSLRSVTLEALNSI